MKKVTTILLLALVVLMTGCATQIDTTNCINTEPSGFFWGWWNGATMFFSFIGSLITNDIVIYDINNNGGWYDLGFILGNGSLFGLFKITIKS